MNFLGLRLEDPGVSDIGKMSERAEFRGDGDVIIMLGDHGRFEEQWQAALTAARSLDAVERVFHEEHQAAQRITKKDRTSPETNTFFASFVILCALCAFCIPFALNCICIFYLWVIGWASLRTPEKPMLHNQRQPRR